MAVSSPRRKPGYRIIICVSNLLVKAFYVSRDSVLGQRPPPQTCNGAQPARACGRSRRKRQPDPRPSAELSQSNSGPSLEGSDPASISAIQA